MWMMLMVCAALAELVMVPEDGRCLPGEEVVAYAPSFDTGGPRTCVWSGDEGLVIEDDVVEGDAIVLTCPDCGGRRVDELFGVYVVCTDEDQRSVWSFDEILVACSDFEDHPAPEGCACGSTVSPALWSLLLLPGVLLRRRGVQG